MSSLRIDKYDVLRHLGNGHFGDVYLCHDPYLQKEFAIKVIRVPDPPKFVNAVKEGRILDFCRQKHMVEVQDVRPTVFNSEAVVIIVMEYLAKGSVESLLKSTFISCKDATRIIRESLMGLEHAHNHNILHRDIKPGNIMIGNSGESKLSDFGFAIDYHTELSDLNGYLPHQPLEVIGGQPMDKLSDIYATGMTYYRLLNNIVDLPFPFSNKVDWFKAVKKNHYPPREFLAHIPDKIVNLVKKGIHSSRDTRFQNCTKFRQALEKLSFYVDWKRIDPDNWVGSDGADRFEISKFRKRTGWFIELRKNRVRKSDYCLDRVPDIAAEAEFYKVIKESTLRK